MPNPVAITMGDPAGIGPEICLKAVSRCDGEAAAPVIFGDRDVLSQVARLCELPVPRAFDELDEALSSADGGRPAILHHSGLGDSWRPGNVSPATGAASYQYIVSAIEAALAERVAGVVTGPIHKEALRSAGIAFPGHTEIFAAYTSSARACMMLTSRELTCSFVTTHVGYHEVPGLLSRTRIFDVIELTHDALCKIHGRKPRLAICGLNPHAGEHGLFGQGEEEHFIIPAVEEAHSRGIAIEGPFPPDTAFLPARRQRTDGFICMYHDQGHIPLKALSFETAVNTTLGLPIVRTSVDHGTALDIAWQGVADETSLVEALKLARQLNATSRSEVSLSGGQQ